MVTDVNETSAYPINTMSLDEFCATHPKVALAFSGGCDSSYLFSYLIDAGVRVKAYMVKTAFQPDFELADAKRIAEELGGEFEVLNADLLSEDAICDNPPDRCYFCKSFIFGTILKHAKKEGYEVLVDGTNASDDPGRRPGFRALSELGVLSPLRLAGLEKEEIRNASRQRGLFTGDKPSFSCLATRIETGKRITAETLESVDEERRLSSCSDPQHTEGI